MKRNNLLLLWLLCWCLPAMGQEPTVEQTVSHDPTQTIAPTVYPGGILQLTYPLIADQAPEFYFGRQRLAALAHGQQWRIFVGIAADIIPGRYVITIHQPDKSNEKVEFVVKPSRYLLVGQPTTTRTRNFILNRLQSRRKNTATTFKVPTLPWANLSPVLPIHYPAQGKWSQTFGELRVKDDNELSYIQHIQLVTTKPQAVLSPTDAICLEINQDNGVYSVWLDHGMGLFSHLSGLTNITIEEQDKIVAGSVISNITARQSSTPQTLQWRLLFNGALINPHIAVTLPYTR